MSGEPSFETDDKERKAAYDLFSILDNKARALLKDDGVMLMHTIGRTGPPSVTSAFIRKYIFPGGYIPALSEIMQPVERSGLHVTDVEVLTDHYAETLKNWRERFMAALPRIRELGFDERFIRMWDYYLCYCEGAFLERAISTVHIVANGPLWRPDAS